jgi:enoyl-CoA hydratase
VKHADRIDVKVDDRIAIVTLNRADVLNAIDSAMCDALIEAIDGLERQDHVSVLVLAGAGRAFCAGADLTHMRTLAGAGLRRFIERTWIVGERIARSPIVSIAALHGYVLGGGAELALACDFRVADSSTRIGFPEMGLGSVPGSGALQRLPRIVGSSQALELITGSERIDGAQAMRMRLVNRIADEETALAHAQAWAGTLSQRPPEALRYAKACLGLPVDGGIAPAMHGLVSGACQAERGYAYNTERFAP